MYPGTGSIVAMGTMRGRHRYLAWLVCIQTNSPSADEAEDEAWSSVRRDQKRIFIQWSQVFCYAKYQDLHLDCKERVESGLLCCQCFTQLARPALEVRALVQKTSTLSLSWSFPVTLHTFSQNHPKSLFHGRWRSPYKLIKEKNELDWILENCSTLFCITLMSYVFVLARTVRFSAA